MTIQEALAQRLPRVRKPEWANPQAYLRLPLLTTGYGPWAELYDDVTQRDVLGVRPGSQRLLTITMMDDDGYEPFTGEASPFEQEGFAKTYAEA